MPGHGVEHHHRPRAPAARRLGRTWLVTPPTIAAPTSRRSLTLDEFLESRSAGFDVVRLVLAFLVLVSHTWPLGGFGSEPHVATCARRAHARRVRRRGVLRPQRIAGRPKCAQPSDRARSQRHVWPASCRPCGSAILVGAFVVALIGWVHRHHEVSGILHACARTARSPTSGRAATLPVSFSHGILDVFVNDTPYGIATERQLHQRLAVDAAIRGPLLRGDRARRRRWLASSATRRTITIAWCISLAIAIGYREASRSHVSFVVGPYADRQLAAFLFVFLTGTLVAAWAHKINLFGWVPVAAFVVAVVSLDAVQHS